jgi:RNA polymerase-binding transcription factor DksA
MIDEQLCNELHEQLVAERERISGEISRISGGGISGELFQDDETDAVDQHPADDGSELFEREKNLTVQRTLEVEIGEIDAALQKFENGTYGLCETCGKPIPEKRLRAYPAATHDVECQSRLERMGRATAVGS